MSAVLWNFTAVRRQRKAWSFVDIVYRNSYTCTCCSNCKNEKGYLFTTIILHCDRKGAGRQDLKRTVTCERRASDNDQDTCKSVSSKLISKFWNDLTELCTIKSFSEILICLLVILLKPKSVLGILKWQQQLDRIRFKSLPVKWVHFL